MSFQKLVLLLAALGIAGPALAQRISPLAPLAPAVAVPPIGIDIPSQFPRPAAPAVDQPARVVRPQPVFLLNSRFIVGSGLAQFNPQDIADIKVYKGSDAPAKWRSLTANGIIAIRLKPHAKTALKTASLTEISKGLNLQKPITYQIEGLTIEDLTLRIATADIARLDAQPTAGGTVINIHLVVPPPAVHPPGTILIRGASGS